MKIQKAYNELVGHIESLKRELEKHIEAFTRDLDTQEGLLVGDTTEEIARLQKHMEEFFREHTVAFLSALAVLIRKTLKGVQRNFGGDYEDIEHIERALGIEEDRIVKYRDGAMTVLFAIGSLRVLENDLVLMLNNSLNGEVMRKDLAKNMLRVVSRKYHDFFHTYATAALTQSYHTAQLIYARKMGYKKFLYVGGLVDESRDFCIERAGHEFFYEDGKSWDDMWWKGKIEGVPFFIQVGGYNCGHHIEWIKDDT